MSNKFTSTWDPKLDNEALTRLALANGTPVRNSRGGVVPGKFDYETETIVGFDPTGVPLTKIRVHVNADGTIYGYPVDK
jgi:hypothetical protein